MSTNEGKGMAAFVPLAKIGTITGMFYTVELTTLTGTYKTYGVSALQAFKRVLVRAGIVSGDVVVSVTATDKALEHFKMTYLHN